MKGGASLVPMMGGASLVPMMGGASLIPMMGGASLVPMMGGASLVPMTSFSPTPVDFCAPSHALPFPYPYSLVHAHTQPPRAGDADGEAAHRVQPQEVGAHLPRDRPQLRRPSSFEEFFLFLFPTHADAIVSNEAKPYPNQSQGEVS